MSQQKKALVTWGGWDGHEPATTAAYFKEMLEKENFQVDLVNSLDLLADRSYLDSIDLLVPYWTMSKITKEQQDTVQEAVANGLGIAGCHAGLTDAFRESVNWQFMVGGNWVSHPGGGEVEYKVEIKTSTSPLTEGIPHFMMKSEQYYLHVDPAVEVLATTRFPIANWYHAANGPVDMPVVWTKRWGLGRIYYSSLGHNTAAAKQEWPTELMRRGFLYAAGGRDYALKNNLSVDLYKSEHKNF